MLRVRTLLATGLAATVALSLATVPMAGAQTQDEVFTTDFSEHPVGEGVPDGWVELFANNHYEIAGQPSRLVKVSNGNPRHVLGWDVPGVVEGDVEVATLLHVPDASRPAESDTRFQLHLHASGEAGSIDTYHVDFTGVNQPNQVRIRRSVNNSQATLASTPAEFDMEGWHNVVFQRRGDTLRAKIWPYSTDEPAEWTVEAEDDSHDSGRVGPGYFGTNGVTQEFAWFSVGTGDQDAVRAPDDIAGIPQPRVPEAPTPSGAANYGAVQLDWPDPAGATRYEVERDGELLAHNWQNTSYADPTVPYDATATYRVRGVNWLLGPGEWSQPITVQAEPLPDELVLPFEADPEAPWTTHQEELDFLADLEAASPRVGVEEIGRSGEGRPMHLVRFGPDGPPDDEEIAAKPTLLITCGIHGSEAASREGCLWFLRELAVSQDAEVLDWLDTYAVLVIPSRNPDGRARDRRNLSTPDIDGNRDHIALTSSEGRAVTRVMRDHQPVALVDTHEWASAGTWQRGEMEVSPGVAANTAEEVFALSAELSFDHIMPTFNEHAGWRSTRYRGWATEYHPTRLRDHAGIRHAVSLLTESGKTPQEWRRLEEVGVTQNAPEVRQRRVASQRAIISETLRFLTENVDRVTAVTKAAVAAAEANQGPVYTDGSVIDPLRSDVPAIRYEPPREHALDPPPCGWAVQAVDEEAVTEVLDLHGVEWETRRLPGGQQVMFVPAAQRDRPIAVAAVDAASPDLLDGASSIRLDDSGWCRRGKSR